MKFLLLLPTVIFYILFTAWPLVEVVKLSFFKTNFMKTAFIGFDNFIFALTDKDFITSILNSFFYAGLMIPGLIISALFLSLILYSMKKKWQDISRIMFYLPVLSAGIIIANSWKWIFHVDGPINWFLSFFNVNVSWFSEWFTAIPVISFIVIFSSFGGNVIIFLSAILSIDKSIYDAAKIDGANDNQIRWKIVVPMIKNSIILVGLLSTIAAFQVFENIYALAPQVYAATMTYEIYITSFMNSKYGLGAAEAVILLIIVLVLSLLKKKVENE